MRDIELQEDIEKVKRYLDIVDDLEVRMALDRLLQILRAWRWKK